jgi:processive 1,2-diacylglycerol beta-glucosyltransferase
MDVLYLSISMGAGHLKAAEALKEYVDQMYPNSRSLVIDTFKYINPLVHKVFVDGYLNIIKRIPCAYGAVYRMSEQLDNINKLSHALSKMFSYKLIKLVEDFKPSIIVCTHPFPLQIVACLKKEKKISIPAIGILTDYTNHPFWFQENIEAYIVAHENIKQDMINTGTPESRIYSYGIPVSKAFLERRTKKDLLQKYGLENKLTVLIMGGSLGFGDIKNIFLAFLDTKKDAQIIVVTGKNTKLKQQLQAYNKNHNKKVILLGYTNEIPNLMDVSDLIITKPGGMTITEALIKELPIFIISPIPGQEERNSHFLTINGIAERIQKDTDVSNFVNKLIDNPYKLATMKKMSQKASTPNSGYKIVSLMEELIYANTTLTKDST